MAIPPTKAHQESWRSPSPRKHGCSARSAVDGLQHDRFRGAVAGSWRRQSAGGDQRASSDLRHPAGTRRQLWHAPLARDFYVLYSGRPGVCAPGTFVSAQTLEGESSEAGRRTLSIQHSAFSPTTRLMKIPMAECRMLNADCFLSYNSLSPQLS